MLNNLKNLEFLDQFEVPYDEEKQGRMKKHEKEPQNRTVFSDGWHEEGVIQRPQPLGPFLRKDLQGCNLLGLSKQLEKPYTSSHKEDCKGKVYHGYQYDITRGVHRSLLLKVDFC